MAVGRARRLGFVHTHTRAHTHTHTELQCPATSYNGAAFQATGAGTSLVQGVCSSGYTGGSIRNCTVDATWIDVSVVPCTRASRATHRGA